MLGGLFRVVALLLRLEYFLFCFVKPYGVLPKLDAVLGWLGSFCFQAHPLLL